MASRDNRDEQLLWRSLDESGAASEAEHVLAAEFSRPAEPERVDRRRLLELMAASLALSGLTGCNSGTQFGAPLWSAPRDIGYGRAAFATALELCGVGRGVVVETAGGRPVKIEGNPLHPESGGATDVFMQAEILSLYDPDRSRTPLQQGRAGTWEQARAELAAWRGQLLSTGGRGLHIVTGEIGSPTLARLLGDIARMYPSAQVHKYDPLASGGEQQGAMRAFGEKVRALFDFSVCDVVLSLGAGFLDHGPDQVRHSRAYALRRARGRESGRMPLIFAAETTPGLTGARADQRLAMGPSEIARFARQVAGALGLPLTRADAGPQDPRALRVADALRKAGSAAVVYAGRDQAADVHALAHAMNAAIGAAGGTLLFVRPAIASAANSGLETLARAAAAGEVGHLLVLEGNPAYDAPADLAFAALAARVPQSLHVGLSADETAQACRWHLPGRHVLERWGDVAARDGTVSIQQPATRPIVEGLSPIEVLALLVGQAGEGQALVEATWRQRLGDRFDDEWRTALERGVLEGTRSEPVNFALRPDWDADSGDEAVVGGVELHFAADPSVWDGRFANNAWLQELPKPISKQVWGNAALVAPETASRFGVKDGDIIDISAQGRHLQAPMMVVAGQAAGAITLPLGYGRRHAGLAGSGVGFDSYRLRTSTAPWSAAGGVVRATGQRRDLITTQRHHSMEGRDIVRLVDAGTPSHSSPVAAARQPSLYPDYAYDGNAWGMTIDLDACIGCNACVIACQAENNVPVVGPEEVAQGREMHWLRIDRYHAGEPQNPATFFQPVPCMQCEKAPCEVVCPVNATVHSAEGLNDMVYNRCVGTRTCSNNCPYKVRRFNWFNYAEREPARTGVDLNPEVTVRPRGVMEKCTYCTQRISAARIAARVEGRAIQDGEVRTACQQACPASAIQFGDLNAADSIVAGAKKSPRNYALLGELNTQPRTTYLARLRPAGDDGERS